MAVILPNAGIAGPIPDDFDFAACLVMPPQKDPTSRSVRIRTAHNKKAERHNEDSMDETLNCRDDRTNHPDVGPELMAMYPYAVDEIETMVESETYCNAIGPLPDFLRKLVVDTRQKNATKDGQKEKGKAKPLLGAMTHTNPIHRIPGERPNTIISDVVLHSILAKQYLPLTWFTNDRLELAQYNIHELHTKLFRPEPTSAGSTSNTKVEIFDMVKMTALWGTDTDYHSLSPLQWHETMANYHAALVKLSPALPPFTDPFLPPIFSFAIEFNLHRQFFARYPKFEETYPIWYPFERQARNEILKGVVFDRSHYVMEVGGILRATKASKTAESLRAPSQPAKRLSDSDLRGATKVPRTVNDSPGSFRGNSTNRVAPTCLTCGGAHILRDHPHSSTTHLDGKPLFAAYHDGELWTVKPHGGRDPKKICIDFNLAGGCRRRHNNGQTHICSLCGRDHSALSQNTACSRVAEEAI